MKLIKRFVVPGVLWCIAAMGLVANSWLVSAATHGNGMTSDSGYYERALRWDAFMEASANATRLGVSFEATLAADAHGAAELCVSLRDASGVVLEPTQASVDASANLCPKQRTTADLTHEGAGYCVTIADACAGVWIIDVSATVGGQRVAANTRTELEAAP